MVFVLVADRGKLFASLLIKINPQLWWEHFPRPVLKGEGKVKKKENFRYRGVNWFLFPKCIFSIYFKMQRNGKNYFLKNKG